jgi:serine/threonine protein kinase
MDGGITHGIGLKGKVMDFEDIHFPKDIQTIHIYVLKQQDIIEKTIPVSKLNTIHLNNDYIIKEFVDPPLPMKLQGYTKKTYLLRELNGFKHILSTNTIIGVPYQKTILYGFEIITPNESRCFVINRKCKETISESKLTSMKLSEWKRFVIDILSELVKIQKINLAHGDIKLDNIMKCKKYQLIDWENSRVLDYEILKTKRYLGLSPMYFQILYGSAWYPAFSVALLKYYRETGGTSDYANRVISYFSSLFQKHTPKEVFEKTKYTFDVGTFGFILDGSKRNPYVPKRYYPFINSMYKMNASEALSVFKTLNKTHKR